MKQFFKMLIPCIGINIGFNSIITYLNDRNKDIHQENTIYKIKIHDLEHDNKILLLENTNLKNIISDMIINKIKTNI